MDDYIIGLVASLIFTIGGSVLLSLVLLIENKDKADRILFLVGGVIALLAGLGINVGCYVALLQTIF